MKASAETGGGRFEEGNPVLNWKQKAAAIPKKPEKSSKETALIKHIMELYDKDHTEHIYLPKGRLEAIAREVNIEYGLENYVLPPGWPCHICRMPYKKTLQ